MLVLVEFQFCFCKYFCPRGTEVSDLGPMSILNLDLSYQTSMGYLFI